MPRLVPLALVPVPVLASLFAVLACSGDDPTPVLQPTATRAPEATARPTATPQPTAMATPQVDRSESAQDRAVALDPGLAEAYFYRGSHEPVWASSTGPSGLRHRHRAQTTTVLAVNTCFLYRWPRG